MRIIVIKTIMVLEFYALPNNYYLAYSKLCLSNLPAITAVDLQCTVANVFFHNKLSHIIFMYFVHMSKS